MIPPVPFRRGLLALAFLGLFTARAAAQDYTPPMVANPIGDLTIPVNSAPTTINLKKTFGLTGVTGQLVRFTTVFGNIDVELYNATAPNTVANFLQYVDGGSYNNTIFHRSTTLSGNGLAVLQGGEATLIGGAVDTITSFGGVNNEYSLPNTRGTIAMAKQADSPDSASDQWFFNVSNNSKVLGSDNDGGFTVFGRVIDGDLITVDTISALGTYNLTNFRSDWTSVPLMNYDGSQTISPANLVVASSVAEMPMLSKGKGFPGAVTVKLKGNTNPGLVSAELKGRKLILTYTPGQTGTAAITLQARSGARAKLNYTFNVNVQ